jgi:hypothetical protein
MWLACYTQEEIAEAEDTSQRIISRTCEKFEGFSQNGNLAVLAKTKANYMDDFETPVYSIGYSIYCLACYTQMLYNKKRGGDPDE